MGIATGPKIRYHLDMPDTGAQEGLKVLVIDIGGTNVKVLATGQTERAQVPVGADR